MEKASLRVISYEQQQQRLRVNESALAVGAVVEVPWQGGEMGLEGWWEVSIVKASGAIVHVNSPNYYRGRQRIVEMDAIRLALGAEAESEDSDDDGSEEEKKEVNRLIVNCVHECPPFLP